MKAYGGKLEVKAGSTAIGDVDVLGGNFVYYATGVLTDLEVFAGRVDFSKLTSALTVTTCVLHKGTTLHDPNGLVVFTNGIKLSGCKLSEVTLDLGKDRTITPS